MSSDITHPSPSSAERVRHGRPARLMALLGVAGALVLTAPAVQASAGEVSSSVTSASQATDTAPASQTFAGGTFTASAGQAATTRALPIPTGLTPTQLTANLSSTLGAGQQVAISVGAQSVTPTVTSAASPGGTQLSTISVPLTDADLSPSVNGQPPTLPVSVSVVDANGQLITCALPGQTVQVSAVAVQYSGVAAAPTSVGTFFNSAIRQITVLTPTGTDPLAADGVPAAALQAVGSLTNAFGSGSGGITTVDIQSGTAATLAAGVDPGTARVVSLVPGKGTATTAVSTDGTGLATMTITGGPGELLAAAMALDDDNLALATSAESDGLSSDLAAIGVTQQNWTLDELTGSSQLTLSGLGSSTSYVGVSQASFGGPISSANLHLVGTATALPATIDARLSVYFNGLLMNSLLLGDGKSFTMDMTVPSGQIVRDNSLILQLDAVADGGCEATGDALPVQVQIDGTASSISGISGQSLDAGFQRFPQVLSGKLPVAFGSTGASGESLLQQAGHYVSGLQRMTTAPLAVSVVSADELINGSQPGLLVGPTDTQVAALQAPLRLGEFRQIAATEDPFSVGVQQPFAALQAFSTGSRDMLVAAAWSPDGGISETSGLLDQLARAADGLSTDTRFVNGWASLSSNLLVSTSTTALVPLNSAALTPQSQVVEVSSRTVPVWIWAVVAVLLILVVAWLLYTRWRRRRSSAPKDGDGTPDSGGAAADHDELDPDQLELVKVGSGRAGAAPE